MPQLADHGPPPAASAWVSRWLDLCRPGTTLLDWAAGGGRHARAAHARGMIATAIDRDQQAVDQLSDLPVERIVADLERGPWPFPDRRFDAVVCTNYLFRPRIALLAALVSPGGAFVYETFALGNERFGRPSNPDFLLRDGELLAVCAAAGLRVVAYEHGESRSARPAVVQRVCAVRGSAPVALG